MRINMWISPLIMLIGINSPAQDIGKQAGQIVVGAGIGFAANAAMYKVMGDTCKTGTTGAWACPLAAQSVTQMGMMLATAGDGGTTKSKIQSDASNFDKGFGDAGGGGGGYTPEEKKLLAETNKNIAELAKKGYTVDKKTGDVTTPKGKFPSKAFANGKAMASAGLISPDQISEVDDLIKKAIKDVPKVVSIGVGGGGGGGSGSSSSAKYNYDDPYKPYYGSQEKPNDPKTSGLTRSLASGESIGSRTDNLFEMVKRKYQEKSEEKIFVGQEVSQ